MLAAEARGELPLLERIVERGFRFEEIAQAEHECGCELLEKYRAGGPIQVHGTNLSDNAFCHTGAFSSRSHGRANSRYRRARSCRPRALPAAAATSPARRCFAAPRS